MDSSQYIYKGRKIMRRTKTITMKTNLAIACLLWLGFGISAQAFDISFGNYDRNHDRRWDRQDYYNADMDWHRNHDQMYPSRRDVYNRFNSYDANHDGYIDENEMRRINAW
jgi:hypothetical protein